MCQGTLAMDIIHELFHERSPWSSFMKKSLVNAHDISQAEWNAMESHGVPSDLRLFHKHLMNNQGCPQIFYRRCARRRTLVYPTYSTLICPAIRVCWSTYWTPVNVLYSSTVKLLMDFHDTFHYCPRTSMACFMEIHGRSME